MTEPSRSKKPPQLLILWNRTDDSDLAPVARPSPKQLDGLRNALTGAGFAAAVVNAEDDVDRIGDAVVVHRPTFVFNLVDHFFGDNTQHAAVAHLLDLFGYQYTGSDALCLASCQDRVHTRLLLADAGVPVPDFAVVRDINAIPDSSKLSPPLIVTQALDDIYHDDAMRPLLDSRDEVEKQTSDLYAEFALPLLIEEYIPGRRVAAIVVGNRVLEVLPLTEIVKSEETGWEEAVLAQLEVDVAGRVRQLARSAYRILGCRDYARIDFVVADDGAVFCTDVRPVMDVLAEAAPFRVSAEHSYYGYPDALVHIARLALARVPALALASAARDGTPGQPEGPEFEPDEAESS
jgi:D-alanine-D-alanine ligase